MLGGHPLEPLGLGQRGAGDQPEQGGFPRELRAEDVQGPGGVRVCGRVPWHGDTQ